MKVKFNDDYINKTRGCKKCEERRKLLEAGAPRLQPRRNNRQAVNQEGRGVSQVSSSLERSEGNLEQPQAHPREGIDGRT